VSPLKQLALLTLLLLPGCMRKIWNAGDLAEWVRQQAVSTGCRPGSIELEDWYRETDGGKVWYGTCQDDRGAKMPIAINVDSVWNPSGRLTTRNA